MKRTSNLLAGTIAIAGFFALGTSANADLINITNDLDDPPTLLSDFDKGEIGGVGNEDVFKFLQATVNAYNILIDPEALPDPVGGGSDGYSPLYAAEDDYTGNPVDLSLFTYVVVHYGTGKDGDGQGGGLVVWYTNGMTGEMVFDPKGSGPNGFGGNSWVRAYGPGDGNGVPDNGMTLALLGLALGGLGLFAKFKPARKA